MSVDPLAERSAKDLHLHINLTFGPDEIAAAAAAHQTANDFALPTSEQLSELAGKIYKARRRRDTMLDCDLFGEPAWDMLLALYCLPDRGERLSITALSLAAGLPQTTGHRWQGTLAERGLIEQVPDERDGRRQFVSLTSKGRRLLEGYLAQLFGRGEFGA